MKTIKSMKTIKLTSTIMHCRYLLLTHVLHIPDLILKIVCFKTFYNELIPLGGTKWYQVEQWKGEQI